jgi:hypothetical protein
LLYRRRRVLKPRTSRRRNVARRRSRRETVSGGRVETVYSIVVGEGRRVWRWGMVVSILRGVVAGGRKLSFRISVEANLQPYRDKE